MNRDHLLDLTVFLLLLAIGIVGRWFELAWNFTPLAAVTVMGGYYFRQLLPALLLPIAILTVSNVLLPAYSHWQVQLAVYAMMLLPMALGRVARGATGWKQWGHLCLCGLVPATAFYVVTNFAVWAATPYYEKTVAGLLNCYWMALPFYRWMLAGDVLFLTTLVASLAIARSLRSQHERGKTFA